MTEEYYEDGEDFFIFDQQIEFVEDEEGFYSVEEIETECDSASDMPPFIRGDFTPDIPWGIFAAYMFGLYKRSSEK